MTSTKSLQLCVSSGGYPTRQWFMSPESLVWTRPSLQRAIITLQNRAGHLFEKPQLDSLLRASAGFIIKSGVPDRFPGTLPSVSLSHPTIFRPRFLSSVDTLRFFSLRACQDSLFLNVQFSHTYPPCPTYNRDPPRNHNLARRVSFCALTLDKCSAGADLHILPPRQGGGQARGVHPG